MVFVFVTDAAVTVLVLPATPVVLVPSYHLTVPIPLTTPASETVCSTPPLNTWAVRTVEPELFLNMVPLEDVIVIVIASAPGAPF